MEEKMNRDLNGRGEGDQFRRRLPTLAFATLAPSKQLLVMICPIAIGATLAGLSEPSVLVFALFMFTAFLHAFWVYSVASLALQEGTGSSTLDTATRRASLAILVCTLVVLAAVLPKSMPYGSKQTSLIALGIAAIIHHTALLVLILTTTRAINRGLMLSGRVRPSAILVWLALLTPLPGVFYVSRLTEPFNSEYRRANYGASQP